MALLDALGTRTGSIAQAAEYLRTLGDIRTVVGEFALNGDDRGHRVMPEHPGGDFRVRFFGDTILITLPFEQKHLNWCPVGRMMSGLSTLIATALGRGILFRGAMAIGEYLESDDAVLGPAVVDAAQWYELPDMLGAIATPNAGFAIQRVLADTVALKDVPAGAVEMMGVVDDVPLKDGKTLRTWVTDWTFSAYVRWSAAGKNFDEWLFGVMQSCSVSPQVESKYRNSLAFARRRRTELKSRARV